MIEDLVRPNIRALTPYSSARSLFTRGTFMDANENPINLFGEAVELNRYPDTHYVSLRKKAAALYGVPLEACAAGSGSDELLDLLLRIFCEPREDELLLSSPTYGNYAVLAAIHDIQVVDVPLTDSSRDGLSFQLNPDAILHHVGPKTKLIFICSPNNPTGNAFRTEDILKIAKNARAIVVLDEAYAEFMRAPSLIPEIRHHENLVVLRTLSKAYAMAGGRIGFALANPAVIAYLQKVKLPYNISILAANQAIAAIENEAAVRAQVKAIVAAREKMAADLQSVKGVEKVFPSDANFILFRIKNAEAIFKRLAEKEIIVRSRAETPGLPDCLRVTVGTEEENRLFLENLKEIADRLSI